METIKATYNDMVDRAELLGMTIHAAVKSLFIEPALGNTAPARSTRQPASAAKQAELGRKNIWHY